MKNNRIIRRLLAVSLCAVTLFALMTATTAPASAAAATKAYSATVYDTNGYGAVIKEGARLYGTTNTSAAAQAYLSKGALINLSGLSVRVGGTALYKVYLDGRAYYIRTTDVGKAATQASGALIKVTKNNAPLRRTPFETGSIKTRLTANTLVQTVGTLKNRYGNLWYIVKLPGESALYFLYGGNATAKYSTDGNLSLDVKTCFQTTNYTCSAAAAQAVLRYRGAALTVSDQTLYKTTQGYVYRTVNAINNYLGKNAYRYSTFGSVKSYEAAIRASLAQGSPVIARVKFSKKYFNYSSNGHYTTIIGIYTDKNGTTWLRLADSFTNRYKSNDYTNASTGIVNVPLSTLYNYGKYGGSSPVYLIYND